MNRQFDVFLCHNTKDKPEVKEIALQLRQRELEPWLDEWEFRPGFPWQRELERQIEHIKSAAVFVGNSGFGPWQEHELEAFLREFVKRQCPVIPVLLPTAPQQPILPIFLSSYMWVDFRLSQPEPMGQLIWGITGIKPQNYKAPINTPIKENNPTQKTRVDSTPSIPKPTIQKDDFSSERRVDYTRLRDLLKQGNWKEADLETARLMLKVANREKEQWLDSDSIKKFPCTDLRTIDQLWVKYSNGHFGFSVQKRIWESVNGNDVKFGGEVGWIWEERGLGLTYILGWGWKEYEELTFLGSAPKGHLPARLFCWWCFGGSGVGGILLSRRDL